MVGNFIFHFIYIGMSSFPLTNSYFQDGYCTTNQYVFFFDIPFWVANSELFVGVVGEYG